MPPTNLLEKNAIQFYGILANKANTINASKKGNLLVE